MIELICERVVLGGGPEPLSIQPARIRADAGLRITEVEPLSQAAFLAAGPGDVDLSGHLLSPAFIDGHTHLALAFLRGVQAKDAKNMVESLFFTAESHLCPEDVRAFARLAAYESLLSGVGLVFDHYYAGLSVAEGLAEVGLSAVIAPTLQDLMGPGKDQHEAALLATETLCGPRYEAQGLFAAVGCHATDTVSAGLWKAAAALSAKAEIPIHAHLAQSYEEYARAMTRHGQSPVRWLAELGVLDAPALFVHDLYLSEADLRLLDPARHRIGYCPHSQLIFGFPARIDRFWEAGLELVLGTDCAPSNDAMNVQKEIRFLAGSAIAGLGTRPSFEAFHQGGSLESARALEADRERARNQRPSIQALLDAVWYTPGHLHPKAQAGAILPGHLMNLCAWDLSHPSFWPGLDPLAALALGDTQGALSQLWVNGRAMGPFGALKTGLLDTKAYREARIEADRRRQALFQRAGI